MKIGFKEKKEVSLRKKRYTQAYTLTIHVYDRRAYINYLNLYQLNGKTYKNLRI